MSQRSIRFALLRALLSAQLITHHEFDALIHG